MCYACYGAKVYHDPNYFLKNTGKGMSTLSSEWGNLRKRYYGRDETTEMALIQYV